MAGFARFKIKIRQPAVRRVQVETSNKTSRKAADKTQDRVRQNMRKKGRVRTGAMVASVRTTPLQVGVQTWYRVHSDLDYTVYQEEGVGPQFARHGKVMRFQPKGSGVFVFARRTKGFKGGHFFRDAYRDVRVQDFD